MALEDIRSDCRRFRGDRPCRQHKTSGAHCPSCADYDKLAERVLVVKLGAAGDVIRTTPLLRKIRQEMPGCHITWLTDFPALLPDTVDVPLAFSDRSATWLMARDFDLLLVLDKDPEAIALAELVRAKEKRGFGMDAYGRCAPIDAQAEHKFITGVYDDESKTNSKSYQQEIFEMCGYEFAGESYELNLSGTLDFAVDEPHPLVGLNTGCGARWPSRMWPEEYWAELTRRLRKKNFGVMLLGGPAEDEANRRLEAETGASYLGYFPLEDFVALVGRCDIIVTQVTMTLHIALAVGSRVVLMNTIFNPAEFDMYGLGEVVGPSQPCDCYYAPQCPHDTMRSISPERIHESVLRQRDALRAPQEKVA